MSTSKQPTKTLSRIHGYWTYRRFLNRSQYWPTERREQYVIDHLRRTLIRAWEGTVFYRRAFKQVGFDPRTDFRSVADLEKLPVLTKQEVREHYDEMTDHRFEAKSVVSRTSGSTGEPLQMRLNESFLALDSACVFRHWSWAGYTFYDRMAAVRTYVPQLETDPFWFYDRVTNTLYLSAYHLSPTTWPEYVKEIRRFQPRVIRGYPSSLSLLAEYARDYRDSFDCVKGIFSSSETLLAGERDRIEGTFGNRLFDWYGMTEPAIVMTECERHEGLHVNWEYGYPEFLPSEELAENERRLVTTSFHNPVMPFIRYDTGDIVRVAGGLRNCSCGRTMPLVHSVAGRKDECIVMPNGRRLPSPNFYSVFRDYRDILRFQIVQYGRSDIVVNLLLRPGSSDVSEMLRHLKHQLQARLGEEIRLDFDLTGRFMTNADGKTLPVVRRMGTRSVEETQEYTTSTSSLAIAWRLERSGENVLKLDWNEAERIPSPAVRKALQGMTANDHYACWYPDPDSKDLLAAISIYVDAPEEQIVLTHGSDLGLELIANAFVKPGDKIMIVSPNYDNFRAMVEQRGAEILKFMYWGDAPFKWETFSEQLARQTPRLVYISNPNNPLGYAIPFPILDRLSAECNRLSCILIVDEAYYEFCGITAVPFVKKYPYCIVTRSFSKAFGLAGLRLGYLVVPKTVMPSLARLNTSKSVTMYSKVAGLAALKDMESVRAYVEEVQEAKEQFYALFREFGIHYRQSMANFITFEHEGALDIVKHMATKNILVRDGSKYGRGACCVRLTVNGRRSAETVIEELRTYFRKYQDDISRACTETQRV